MTSIAFRAWNRGLAATDTGEEPDIDKRNPYGVWLYNGVSWFPSPGFPGYSACPGHTVVWAGKLDYWLIGGPSDSSWSPLCRFDGATLEWEALELPAATLQHATVLVGSNETHRLGGITSAACFAWNNCWFFGPYGTVVHWNGVQLSDASPDPSLAWLQGEYTAAVARQDPLGNPFAVAVGATAERYVGASGTTKILPEHEGAAPPEMQVSSGGAFSPVAFTPPTSPQPEDPYRTDLVAVDFDAAGQGWVAGNPAGLRVFSLDESSRPVSSKLPPPPSPLVPVSRTGASTTCAGPQERRFTFTPPAFNAAEPPNSFLWSAVAVVPGAGEALAGGRLLPKQAGVATDPNAKPEGEPVIAQASCDGTTTVTRFRVEDPTYKGSPKPLVPADRKGRVEAVAANAPNDAWVATNNGSLEEENSVNTVQQPPHLYRLTDGAKPNAPEGDDLEERPLELQLDPPIVVLEPPPPPPPPPPPATVTKTHQVKLPPAIYGVKAKLRSGRHNLSLYLSFRVRRPVTLGAQALRHGRVVSEARPRRFTGPRGLLILELDRKRWPTKVRFVA